MNSRENVLAFTNLVLGRTVALVGGAPLDAEQLADPRLRFADLVVRVNNHWMEQAGRCDIIYHNGCGDVPAAESLAHPDAPRLKAFVSNWGMPDSCRLARDWCAHHGVLFLAPSHNQHRDLNPCGPSFECLNILHKRYCFKPFTGVLALEHLRHCGAALIWLTGWTLYADAAGWLPDFKGPHEIRPHVRYMIDVLEHDSRVDTDPRLASILIDNGKRWGMYDQKTLS